MIRRLLATAALAALAALAAESPAAAKACPNIMLVLDKSGSMLEDVNGNAPDSESFRGKSKWELQRDVVIDVVKAYGGSVPFGLMMFEGGAFDDVACREGRKVEVPVGHSSAGRILDIMRTIKTEDLDPNAQTPTNGAIYVARNDPALKIAAKEQFILLITDGDPNCGSDKSFADMVTHEIPSDTEMYPNTSLDELKRAFKQTPRITTFVVGFDGNPEGVNKVNLQNMGYWGRGGTFRCGSQGFPDCYFGAGVSHDDFKRTLDMILAPLAGEFSEPCDDSCYGTPCPSGQICTTDESNPEPHCANDPCMGAKCAVTQFCRQGSCIEVCSEECTKKGQKCVDGTCQPDLCVNAKCASSQTCDPKNGNCVDFPCAECQRGSYCDIEHALCAAEQCNVVTCPAGFKCTNHGNCEGSGVPAGAGCSCRTGATASPNAAAVDGPQLFAAAALLASLALMLRRRRAPIRSR